VERKKKKKKIDIRLWGFVCECSSPRVCGLLIAKLVLDVKMIINYWVKYLFAPCALRPLFFASSVSLFIKFDTGGI
jgi:hypothetical protein